MNDFTRPFTENEFNRIFQESGYPEIARQYCNKKLEETINSILNEDLSEDDLKDLDRLITVLKTQEHWTADTVREQSWIYVKEYSHVDEYIHQREIGHGHEWAKQFCEELTFTDIDDTETYWNTFNAFRSKRFKSGEEIEVKHNWSECSTSDSLSCREYVIAVKELAKGDDEIVERYIDYQLGSMYEGKTDELFQEAMTFKQLYLSLIKDGYNEHKTFEYALDLFDEHYPVFYEVYREAMRHGQEPLDAWSLANFCEEAAVNEILSLETIKFKKNFVEPWQREIYAGLLIKDMLESRGSISTLHENDIRKELDLKPVDKSLTWEDEEFLRLKNEYIKKGLNEFVAEQRAYKEVYENDSDITIDGINHKHANDFNREMLEMMFPNEDIESEDFEDGLDMEDVYD